MAQTTDLLSLVDEFPIAFLDPESQDTLSAGNSVVSPISSDPAGRTQRLLQLMDEFAPAFADPESAPSPKLSAAETQTKPMAVGVAQALSVGRSKTIASPAAATTGPVVPQATAPAGYTHALHRQLHTISWGQIEAYLKYGDCRLQSIWIAVGKSGTEVQSLCEAIARLINLLLARQAPIPEIVREIRGIRGADSEGFGPNRVLGLADLIGKVLQEAPVSLVMNQTALPAETLDGGALVSNQPSALTTPEVAIAASTENVTQSEPTASSAAYTWASIPDESQAASLCPECGAELQVMNGCSGGACHICGYSSCS